MAKYIEGLKPDKLQRLAELNARLDRINKRKAEIVAEKKIIIAAGVHANRRKMGKT